ncbi:MAG: Asp23/Gls24 family envelope stress response protein [Thermovirgaceae bacterium]
MSAAKKKPEEENIGEAQQDQEFPEVEEKVEVKDGEKFEEVSPEPEEKAGNEIETAAGTVRIAEEVIAQIATQALLKIEGVQPANPGLVANLRLGKKASGGVRIAIEEGTPPGVSVEAYVTVQYGLRIPDVAWDVQESIKKTLEQYTGYVVKSVNVYVQGLFFEQEQVEEKGGPEDQEMEAGEPDQG